MDAHAESSVRVVRELAGLLRSGKQLDAAMQLLLRIEAGETNPAAQHYRHCMSNARPAGHSPQARLPAWTGRPGTCCAGCTGVLRSVSKAAPRWQKCWSVWPRTWRRRRMHGEPWMSRWPVPGPPPAC